jgi:hypothetical protein
MLIVASIILVPTTNVRADGAPAKDCNAEIAPYREWINDCEALLKLSDKVIEAQDAKIEAQDKLNVMLTESARIANDRYYNSIPAWYEKPSFVAPAAAFATLIAYNLLRPR